ncbi:M16 family metallopeptidase [Xanthovirga aplysinae]|uniref:M16 family metallopeptidase n=1 Tax=Xanthovirga aplysinae TaxID=2529853 RepID=UPI0012BBA2A3|nr:pitrilysin family protein [Xanthovirga aplysinae]MTI33425.1 insulinase family protein [Xanthovirga aplysinae]
MEDYQLHTLSNGIRVVHQEVTTTKIVHCGFILDIGSRDERAEQQGIAHFWEHMAFKGTKKRKAFHILNRLESVGGELNAYTTKEKICFYASVLSNYFEQAFELLTDITFHSIFPEKQIEKERHVILEEMAMYHDSPEDSIQDELDTIIFKNHPLGKNILGTQQSVLSFQQQDFFNFIAENIDTNRLIFSCSGNIPMKKVVRLAEKLLNDIQAQSTKRKRLTFRNYQAEITKVNRALTQSQCAMGRDAYSLSDKRRMKLFTLVNILGGPGMNSRLNMALREKYAYVYAIDAQYNAFLDTGIFSIFFGTEPRQLPKSIEIVFRELKKLQEIPLGSIQLHRAKEQLFGQLAMAEENHMNLMLMRGKSLLDLNKIYSLDEIFEEIRNITANDLQEIALEMFNRDDISILSYLPEKES